VERAAIMCPESVITAAFLHSLLQPGGPRQAAQSPASWDLLTSPRPLEQAKEELERLFVQAQLQLNEWDIPKTAEVLGIQRTNLHRKIRQLGIRREQ
jgi:two-component system nitrogen regulation response regulator NtrX